MTKIPFSRVTRQQINRYLKKHCELAGFNTPLTYYKSDERMEDTPPKCDLTDTHAARRTFICFAFSSGNMVCVLVIY